MVGVYNRAATPCRVGGVPQVLVRAAVPLRYVQRSAPAAPGAPATTGPVVLVSGPARDYAEARVSWPASCPAGRRRSAFAHGFVRVPGVGGLLPLQPRAALLPRCQDPSHAPASVMSVSAFFTGRAADAP